MTSSRAAVVLAFVMGASPCAAVYPPAPPPRPPEFRSPITKPTLSEAPQPPPRPAGLFPYTAKPGPQSPSPVLSPLAETEAACDALLASGLVVAVRIPSIVGTGGCGIAAPVSLKAIILADKRRVDLAPAPTMRCELAAEVARWIVEDVAPLLEGNGRKIARLANAESYDCRVRNGVIGAKLSEHGTGDALDLDAVQFFVSASPNLLIFVPRASDSIRHFRVSVRPPQTKAPREKSRGATCETGRRRHCFARNYGKLRAAPESSSRPKRPPCRAFPRC